MKARLSLVLWLLSALGTSHVCHALAPRQIQVAGSRVHIGDVWPDAPTTVASLDLGPSPQAGGFRVFTRNDMVAAFDREHEAVPSGLPDAVRVVRRTKHLAAWEVDAIARAAIASKPMRHGVVLAIVNAERALDVADGYARVDVEVPRTPKKAGGFSTSAMLSFVDGDEQVLSRVSVPIVLAVSAEGATYDTPRGTSLTLVVRRGLVEVRVPGVATVDGDVGDPVPVRVGSSGRVLRARLFSKDEALETEGVR